MNVRPFESRSEVDRIWEALDEAVHELASGWSKGRVIKTGLIAGGLAALTAGSAGISSLRRREGRERGGS